MKQNEIFSQITEKLKNEYTKKNMIIPSYRYIDDGRSLYIVIRYQKDTSFNYLKSIDIYFSITLDERFPKSQPYVRCLTYFSFPNLYDNSNLFKSIMLCRDKKINNDDYSSTIEDIIFGIPLLIKKVKQNEEKKILDYQGEYTLDEIYEINDFLGGKVEFFRVNQIIKNTEVERYIILTDVYFLLLDPAPNSKNLCKLIFYGDIINLMNTQENLDQKYITIIFDNNEKIGNEKVTFIFKFIKKLNEFKEIRERKLKTMTKFLGHKTINSWFNKNVNKEEEKKENNNEDNKDKKNNNAKNKDNNGQVFKISKSFIEENED